MVDGSGAEIVNLALKPKPELIVYPGDLPATTEALRDTLAASGKFFDRGMPVRTVRPADGGPPAAEPLTRHSIVMEAHKLCRPVQIDFDGKRVAKTLPDRVSQLYLDMRGEWRLPALAGVSTAPLLSNDEILRQADGYDPETGLWCCKVPPLRVPMRPMRAEADTAMRLLRKTFETFPFGDSRRRFDPDRGVEVVDISAPPGHDESRLLCSPVDGSGSR